MAARKIIYFLMVLTVVHCACARIPEQNELSAEDVSNSEKHFNDFTNTGYGNHSQFNVMSSVKNEYYGTHINEPQSNKDYLVCPNVTCLCDCGGKNEDGNQDQDKAIVGVKHNNTVPDVRIFCDNHAFLKTHREAKIKRGETVHVICVDMSWQRAKVQWSRHPGDNFLVLADIGISGTHICQAPDFLGQPGSEAKIEVIYE